MTRLLGFKIYWPVKPARNIKSKFWKVLDIWKNFTKFTSFIYFSGAPMIPIKIFVMFTPYAMIICNTLVNEWKNAWFIWSFTSWSQTDWFLKGGVWKIDFIIIFTNKILKFDACTLYFHCSYLLILEVGYQILSKHLNKWIKEIEEYLGNSFWILIVLVLFTTITFALKEFGA